MKCMPTEEGFVVMIFSESVPKESLVAFLQIEFRSVDGFRTIEVFEPAKWGAHFTDIVNWLSKFKKKPLAVKPYGSNKCASDCSSVVGVQVSPRSMRC